MSWICSQVSADLASALNEPECAPSRFAKSIHTAAECSQSTGQAYPAMKTCESLPPHGSQQMELPSMQCAGASRVRMFQSRTSQARALQAHAAAYGLSMPALLASYDPASSSLRTSQSCLIEGWAKFSDRWPRSGMMRSGECYAVSMLDYPSSESGSGLLPRPAARDGKDVSSTSVHLASRQRHQPSAATRLLEQGVHWTLISRAYERIMGFPSRWSAAVYTDSEMQSRLKSRKSSGVPL